MPRVMGGAATAGAFQPPLVAAGGGDGLVVLLEQLLGLLEGLVVDDLQVREVAEPLLVFFRRALLLADLARQGVADVGHLTPTPPANVLFVSQQSRQVLVPPLRLGRAVVLGGGQTVQLPRNPAQRPAFVDEPVKNPLDPGHGLRVDHVHLAGFGVAAPAALLASRDGNRREPEAVIADAQIGEHRAFLPAKHVGGQVSHVLLVDDGHDVRDQLPRGVIAVDAFGHGDHPDSEVVDQVLQDRQRNHAFPGQTRKAVEIENLEVSRFRGCHHGIQSDTIALGARNGFIVKLQLRLDRVSIRGGFLVAFALLVRNAVIALQIGAETRVTGARQAWVGRASGRAAASCPRAGTAGGHGQIRSLGFRGGLTEEQHMADDGCRQQATEQIRGRPGDQIRPTDEPPAEIRQRV